jgi:hypothetical protein
MLRQYFRWRSEWTGQEKNCAICINPGRDFEAAAAAAPLLGSAPFGGAAAVTALNEFPF